MGRSPGLAPFSRVIGQPEISTDGFHSYRVAIRDAFGDSASHGVIVKPYQAARAIKADGRNADKASITSAKAKADIDQSRQGPRMEISLPY